MLVQRGEVEGAIQLAEKITSMCLEHCNRMDAMLFFALLYDPLNHLWTELLITTESLSQTQRDEM